MAERGVGDRPEYLTPVPAPETVPDAGLLLAARPDAITVTSSEALGYLWNMFNDQDRAILRNIALFVPHPRIAGLAREQGWLEVQVTASGDDGMLSALITWARQRTED